jgi:DNA-directed RNA polymerase specialized sigma24 family protein
MSTCERTADAAPRDFDEFFLAEYPLILRAAYWVVGDRAEAVDVAQEAFTRLFVRWKRVSTVTDVATALGCSASTAKVHLHRARAGLGRALAAYAPP